MSSTHLVILILANIAGVPFGFFFVDICRWLWRSMVDICRWLWRSMVQAWEYVNYCDVDPQSLKYVIHIYPIGFSITKVSDGGSLMRERCEHYGQPYIEQPPIFKKKSD